MSGEPANPAAHLARYRWAKGQSGNPGGRPKGRSFRAALAKVLSEKHNGKSRTELLAEVLFREAIKGKSAAIKELLDRLEGKAGELPAADSRPKDLVLRIVPAKPLNPPGLLHDGGRENARVVEGWGQDAQDAG